METVGALAAPQQHLREGAAHLSLDARDSEPPPPGRQSTEKNSRDGSGETAAVKRNTDAASDNAPPARVATSATAALNAKDAEWGRLMRASLEGDQAAYRNLLAGVSPYLRAMARRGCARVGFSASQAEDVVQETLLAIHLKRHTWDPGRSFLPWISVIARNKLFDAMRRRGRRAEVNVEDFQHALVAPLENNDFEQRDALRLLERLPVRQREAIESTSIRGESFREAAKRLSMTEGALRVTIHRGLKTLAALHRKSS